MPDRVIGPGSGNILRARLVIVSGPSGGVFIYSGTPALGNPPIVSETSGTTDPYGNVVIPTIQVQGGGKVTVGAAGGPQVVLISNADYTITATPAANVTSFAPLKQLVQLPSNNSAETSPSMIGNTLITYTNGETSDAILTLSGVTASATPFGTFSLALQQSSGQTYDSAVIEGQYKISGSAITLTSAFWRDTGSGQIGAYGFASQGTIGPPVLGLSGSATPKNLVPGQNVETWHALTAGNSWTGTVYYRMTLDNEVYLWSNNLTAPATSINGVTIVTLPSAYAPNVSMTFQVQQSVSGFGQRFTLAASTGTLQSTGVSASAGVSLGYRVPLDLP
jgi:hypothetical protein